MTDKRTGTSLSVTARIAGLMYRLVSVIGILNANFVDLRLVVPGDDAATVKNIVAHGLWFRIGMAATLTRYAGVVVLSRATHVMPKAVHPNLGRLGIR